MTSKERFFAVLDHKSVDRLPVVPFIGNWAAHLAGYKLGEYHTDGKKMADAQLKAWRKHGLDEVNPQSDNYYIADAMGVKLRIQEDDTPAVIERPLKSLDDIPMLRVPDPYTEGRMPIYLEAVEILAREVGDEVIVRCPGTGPFSLAGHLLGVEEFIVQLAITEMEDDEETRQKLHALMDVCTRSLIAFCEACVKKGATLVMNGDSLASINMTSPDIYRKYCFKYEKMFFDAMNVLKKDYKFATMLHVCGDNTLVADDMMKTGCDIIEIDYAVNLPKYKELSTKNNVCMLGNLNPAGNILFGTPKDVYDEAMGVLEIAAQDGFFMLGSGCEIAVRAKLENVQVMIRAAEDFAEKQKKQ